MTIASHLMSHGYAQTATQIRIDNSEKCYDVAMDFDVPEYEESNVQSGLYKFCAICGRDILLLQSFDVDAGEVCKHCYEDQGQD